MSDFIWTAITFVAAAGSGVFAVLTWRAAQEEIKRAEEERGHHPPSLTGRGGRRVSGGSVRDAPATVDDVRRIVREELAAGRAAVDRARVEDRRSALRADARTQPGGAGHASAGALTDPQILEAPRSGACGPGTALPGLPAGLTQASGVAAIRQKLDDLLHKPNHVGDLGGDLEVPEDQQAQHALSRAVVERAVERFVGAKVVNNHAAQHRGGTPGVGDVELSPVVCQQSLLTLHGLVTRHVTGAFLAVRQWLQRRAWVRRAAALAPRPSGTTDRAQASA